MEASLDYMKACCEIQDNRYWKLWLYPGEVFNIAASVFGERLVFSTKDGFTIELQIETTAKRFHGPPWAYFMAFVTIPEYYLDLGIDPQKNFRFHQELIYHYQRTFGWYHDHYYDGNLLLPMEDHVDHSVITGPVQVMEEAREFIREILRLEEEMKKQKTRERMSQIEEELIQKSCHPHRLEKWLEQGFDPFCE